VTRTWLDPRTGPVWPAVHPAAAGAEHAAPEAFPPADWPEY